jgi:hypothetical protein
LTDRVGRPLAWVLATYAAWVGATYLLEGLPRTLQRPEVEGLRVLYAVLANLLVGVGGSGLVLARTFEQHALPPAAAGVNSPHRTIVMGCVGLAAGAAVYELQSPPSRTLAVLVNGFAQVLPVSAAEVLVCWVLPSTVAAMSRFANPAVARLVAVVPGSVLFGLYHIAHSPPFNSPSMILFLTAVGALTGFFFLASGDLWATILFHNFLALHGVLSALERTPAVHSSEIRVPLVVLGAMTLIVLGVVHWWLLRTMARRQEPRPTTRG